MGSLSFKELTPGYEFPSSSYELDDAIVSKYLRAVESPSQEFIPPLAIAAYAMKSMIDSLSLPPGSIHASQEFEFIRPVSIGTTITCNAKVDRKIARSRMNMLVLEISVFNQDKEKVQSGKTTIVLPAMDTND